MNNEISQKLRLIACGLYMVSTIPSILLLLIQIVKIPVGTILIVSTILVFSSQSIIALFAWKKTQHIHPFVDRSGRDALNCALNTLLGRIAATLFCTFIFSVTCGIGNPDPSLFLISLLILSCVELAYFTNSVISGIFALRGYSFNNRLIYPFIRSE
jgi:uncharacterized Tic20 family protein